MGVRGLTSFIARNAELYLKPFELHDCNLVIDGDNLACNLYKDGAGKNSAFGGDYDCFYRTIVEFFHVLSECNIRAYVLMDGGYEKKKMRTVWQRLRGKVSVIRHINIVKSDNIFPLMMREVFVDALNDCGIPVMRCVFEADEELAALGRKLNCPVLSYDSDFYIYNVKYIPLVTLTLKAYKKRVSDRGISPENAKLSKSSAKHLEKRSKSQKITKGIQVNAEDKRAPKTGKTYKYLDCCLYKIENLIERSSLSKEKLPLFAALLGNDYIPRTAFKSFFSQMKQKGMGKKTTRMHKRIRNILQWLNHETTDSALDKILGTLKKPERNKLLAQIKGAVEGYYAESCVSYRYFKTRYENAIEEGSESENDESTDEADEDEDPEENVSDKETEEDEEADDEDDTKEEEENLDGQKLTEDENQENEISCESESSEEINDDDDDDDNDDAIDSNHQFLPEWFRDLVYSANLPRFLVDLAHLRIYINNPQIEFFPFRDCNEIGLPILKHIFCLLHNVEGDEDDKIFKGKNRSREGEEIVPYLRYLTRLCHVTNIHTVRYPIEPPPDIAFNPMEPDEELFRVVFRKLKLDCDLLFLKIEEIPSDLRLYFLSLIYWLHNGGIIDVLHLHSLLICLVMLRTVDSKIEPIRNCQAFQKRYGDDIKKIKLIRSKAQPAGLDKEMRPEIKNLSIPDRMKFISKSDCLLVQENLLKHYHMQELFNKKYEAFSSIILHGFSEFQSVVFNLHGLNELLNQVYESPKMAQAYCGMFVYNIYVLLRSRIDIHYFISHHVFRDSPMMLDLYNFFWNWCGQFLPNWRKCSTNLLHPIVISPSLRRKRAAAKKRAAAERKKAAAERKKAAAAEIIHQNPETLKSESSEDQDEFYDLNNKFCTLCKIK